MGAIHDDGQECVRREEERIVGQQAVCCVVCGKRGEGDNKLCVCTL